MISRNKRVGIIGATSLVGECLLPLLIEEGWDVVAFTRQERCIRKSGKGPVVWRRLETKSIVAGNGRPKEEPITLWIHLAPLIVLSQYFPMLLACGAEHIVAVSSTSRFTKANSSDPQERKLAEDLAEAESALARWAANEKITFTILRPTLIYGLGRDKNVSVIASFIRRFSVFCIFGEASGLRQPIHAQDVASCCMAALGAEAALNKFYNISGGEILDYREMVRRIFSALGKKTRFVKIPLWIFRLAVFALRIIPRFRNWSAAMAERMNQDLAFDHKDARRDLNFSPRNFSLSGKDLPGN